MAKKVKKKKKKKMKKKVVKSSSKKKEIQKSLPKYYTVRRKFKEEEKEADSVIAQYSSQRYTIKEADNKIIVSAIVDNEVVGEYDTEYYYEGKKKEADVVSREELNASAVEANI